MEEADVENFGRLFAEFLRLHAARWAQRGEGGMLTGDLEDFHRRVASCMLEQGLLRLYALRLGGQSAAVFYGFATPDRWVYYLGGFAPDFERYSPGTLVVGHAVEQAIEAGARAFDFLRGGEPYKYAWGAVDERLYAHTVRRTVREVDRAA